MPLQKGLSFELFRDNHHLKLLATPIRCVFHLLQRDSGDVSGSQTIIPAPNTSNMKHLDILHYSGAFALTAYKEGEGGISSGGIVMSEAELPTLTHSA